MTRHQIPTDPIYAYEQAVPGWCRVQVGPRTVRVYLPRNRRGDSMGIRRIDAKLAPNLQTDEGAHRMMTMKPYRQGETVFTIPTRDAVQGQRVLNVVKAAVRPTVVTVLTPPAPKCRVLKPKPAFNLAAWLARVGAVPAKPGALYAYTVVTRLGPLRIHPGDNLIACRFDDVKAAQVYFGVTRIGQDRLNPYSGKWNWHTSAVKPTQADLDALTQTFQAHVQALLPASPEVYP